MQLADRASSIARGAFSSSPLNLFATTGLASGFLGAKTAQKSALIAGMAAIHAGLAGMGFTALNAYCVMVFCLLYVPCAATIGVIKKALCSQRA